MASATGWRTRDRRRDGHAGGAHRVAGRPGLGSRHRHPAGAGRPRALCGVRGGPRCTWTTSPSSRAPACCKGGKPRTRAARRRGVGPDRVVGRERRGTRPVALHQVRGRAGRPAAHGEIRSLAASVGIAVLHPHTLRHTFATSAVDSGAEVLRLATALGHDSPTTTMRHVRGRDVVIGSPVHAGARTWHRRRCSIERPPPTGCHEAATGTEAGSGTNVPFGPNTTQLASVPRNNDVANTASHTNVFQRDPASRGTAFSARCRRFLCHRSASGRLRRFRPSGAFLAWCVRVLVLHPLLSQNASTRRRGAAPSQCRTRNRHGGRAARQRIVGMRPLGVPVRCSLVMPREFMSHQVPRMASGLGRRSIPVQAGPLMVRVCIRDDHALPLPVERNQDLRLRILTSNPVRADHTFPRL